MTVQGGSIVALVVWVASGIAGCSGGPVADSGEDALRALEGTEVTGRYNDAFWNEQRRNTPDLWAQAIAYCDGRIPDQYPNCRPVLSLLVLERTLERPPTPSPGFDGSIDMSGWRDSAERRLESLPTPR